LNQYQQAFDHFFKSDEISKSVPTGSKSDTKSALNKFNCGLALSKLGDNKKNLELAVFYFEAARNEFKD
jgi:hypothetical protein